MRTFAVGDIHGNYRALKQVLEKAEFDYETDILITQGDIVDGFDDVYACVEELLKIKNRIDIRGNHDDWFLTWLNTGVHPDFWKQGGFSTAKSYADAAKLDKLVELAFPGQYDITLDPLDIPESHWKFFEQQNYYYKDEENRVFVHGGFYNFRTLQENRREPQVFYWDRDLWNQALSVHKGEKLKFKEEVSEIFIGHTKTLDWGTDQPMKADIVWNLDTGAGGRNGRLTLMNIDTHEYFQSDKNLYEKGGR